MDHYISISFSTATGKYYKLDDRAKDGKAVEIDFADFRDSIVVSLCYILDSVCVTRSFIDVSAHCC